MLIKFCKAVTLISHWLDRICRVSAIGFLSLMLLLVLFQVLARYIFQAVPVWTEEAARYCMVWGGLLGATVSFKSDYDPRLIQPPVAGPKAWLISASFFRAMATVLFFGPVLFHCNRFLSRNYLRLSDALEIRLAFVVVVVPIFIVVIFVHLTARLMGDDVSSKKWTSKY